MLFQVLCGFEPIFYTTHPNEESIYFEFTRKNITDCSNEIDKKHLSVKTG